jgi:hypoxanthine phosphoribosyltransferase
MAEDAIGYIDEDHRKENGGWSYLQNHRKKILIVDDINDEGSTLNWIKSDWAASTAGVIDSSGWDDIWGITLRIAVLYDNESSRCELPISYSAVDINKSVEDQWIVFPWESWWER